METVSDFTFSSSSRGGRPPVWPEDLFDGKIRRISEKELRDIAKDHDSPLERITSRLKGAATYRNKKARIQIESELPGITDTTVIFQAVAQ